MDILNQNMRSANPVSGKAPDGQSSAPNIPPLKQVGFTGQIIKGTERTVLNL
jgi:hypothetical protein